LDVDPYNGTIRGLAPNIAKVLDGCKWDKEVYPEVGAGTLTTSEVYLFTEMPIEKRRFNRREWKLHLKRFLVKRTPLGAHETILPTNGSEVALSELKRDSIKASEGMRWFWERNTTTYHQEDLYHAFSTAYTHATKGLIFTKLARDFMSAKTIGTLEKLDEGTMTVRSVAARYVCEYMAFHPLYRIFQLLPEIYENTLTHISNQLVISGLRARARRVISSSTGYGLIDVPGSKSVFGRSDKLPTTVIKQPKVHFAQYFRKTGPFGAAPPSETRFV
jgi:hypothetical protein